MDVQLFLVSPKVKQRQSVTNEGTDRVGGTPKMTDRNGLASM